MTRPRFLASCVSSMLIAALAAGGCAPVAEGPSSPAATDRADQAARSASDSAETAEPLAAGREAPPLPESTATASAAAAATAVTAVGVAAADVPQDDATASDVAASAPSGSDTADATSDATATSTAVPTERGRTLYAQHCAACHGEQGNGAGLAVKFLNPKPRDFRAGRFRLISTTNSVPTRDDIETVLERGMPGSSMVSWAHLSRDDRRLLADMVLAFRRDGAADIERQLAADADEELTDAELVERVAAVTTPADVFAPGDLAAPTAESIARGKELYVSKGCAACHGPTGRGDGQQQMVDAEGFATRPRDLTLGIYKGNHDPVSVYRRLWLGLPGSPMPASQNLTKEEVAAMVDFCLSLSDDATRESWVLRRRGLMAVRLEAVPGSGDESAWAGVPVTEVQVSPLWWREGATPHLRVQAARDDDQLALRITWTDATANERAVLPDEFEDLVAAQFHEGGAEPFLGMGAVGTAIDLWQWRAGYKANGAEDQTSDEYPFDTPLYEKLLGDATPPDFLTARAAGNPLAARSGSAGSLVAAGFGSTTFRPKVSQLVEAEGKWNDGTWSVVLRRPLAVDPDGGVTFKAGDRYSVAFAVWDGAARDRAAQKLISLWNDLVLE